MKRAGFTLIELIFVIVIIGILSAVALPKFLGVSNQAHLANVKSYVASLNMTVGPALWSQSLSDGNSGKVNGGDYNTTSQIKTPSEITWKGTDGSLTNCGTTAMTGSVGNTFDATTVSSEQIGSAAIGTTTYMLGCTDGNATSAPHFWLLDSNTSTSAKVIVE